jgi:hypothetical protein
MLSGIGKNILALWNALQLTSDIKLLQSELKIHASFNLCELVHVSSGMF